jgi:hypothetical protein
MIGASAGSPAEHPFKFDGFEQPFPFVEATCFHEKKLIKRSGSKERREHQAKQLYSQPLPSFCPPSVKDGSSGLRAHSGKKTESPFSFDIARLISPLQDVPLYK